MSDKLFVSLLYLALKAQMTHGYVAGVYCELFKDITHWDFSERTKGFTLEKCQFIQHNIILLCIRIILCKENFASV